MSDTRRYFIVGGAGFIGRHFSDIHCGMRGITRDALYRIDLQSQSWEYASEMVLKSVRMELRTAAVPVRFLKDQEGRFSHHKRAGWFSPWHAAWINLRAMFIYGADFFLFRPGLVLLFLGVLLTLPMTFGPVRVGPVTFSLYWMLLGLSLSVLGLHGFYLGARLPISKGDRMAGFVVMVGSNLPGPAPGQCEGHGHGC